MAMQEGINRKMEHDAAELLSGGLRERALRFAAYLDAIEMTPVQAGPADWKIPYGECYVCMMQFRPDSWALTFFFGDYSGDFGEDFVSAVQRRVQTCTHCHDGCTGGLDAVIFAREYKNVCSQLTIHFENPDEKALDYLKILIEYGKTIAPGSVSWHAHN